VSFSNRRAGAFRVPSARLGLALLVAAATLLYGASEASAFGTVEAFGQAAEHEKIARAALACPGGGPSDGTCFEAKSIDELAGKKGTFGGVGAPDRDEVTNSDAHCDDADYLDQPGYPQSRAQATAALESCLSHLRAKFTEAWIQAKEMVSDGATPVILPDKVKLGGGCPFRGTPSGLGKCDVLDQFGRALHGAQDFHSHSNFNDRADSSKPISITNPPGLGETGAAPFFNLRNLATGPIPRDLSTGCFSFNPLGCRGRVTHGTLNKDEGKIDPVSGATSNPKTARGKIDGGANFAAAVAGAIAETRRQWEDLRQQILSAYGPTRGALMICALTRDDPVKDCQGRKLAIVIDSSGSNEETDPGGLRIAAGQAFNSSLLTAAEAKEKGTPPDQSAVISFESAASVLSPLGDPSGANFAGIGAFGGTCIACGVSTASSLLTESSAGEEPPYDRDGIVVLTDGEDEDVGAIIAAIEAAAAVGIRTSIGFLSPPPTPVPLRRVLRPGARRTPLEATASALLSEGGGLEPDPALVSAVQASGGIVAVISSAEAQRSFVNVVLADGLTAADDANGTDDGGILAVGIQVRGRIDPQGDSDVWTFTAKPKEKVRVTLAGPGKVLKVRVAKTGKVLKKVKTQGVESTAEFTLTGKKKKGLNKVEMVVTGGPGKAEPGYRIGLAAAP
jgi:hypothetical protein